MRHPQERLQRRPLCGDRGAWRELSGYDHPADPIGPEHGAAAPGPARRLARGPHRPRPRQRARRPRPARRHPAARARHLPPRDRLGTAILRRRTPPGPRRRRPRRPPGRHPRRRRSPGRPNAAASTSRLPSSRFWPRAIRPCTMPTWTAKRCSPSAWPAGPTGTPPPPTSVYGFESSFWDAVCRSHSSADVGRDRYSVDYSRRVLSGMLSGGLSLIPQPLSTGANDALR